MSLSTTLQNELSTLQHQLGQRQSLAPNRDYATPLDQLYTQLLDEDTDSSLATALAQGIAQMTRAMSEHFPENIFADVDFLTAALLAQTRRPLTNSVGMLGANNSTITTAQDRERHSASETPDPSLHLAALFDRVAALVQLYGCHSAIRFRYIHDFLYGFDWARWVYKDPLARSAIGPFDAEFLDYLQMRGTELLALIANGDRKYPPLAPDQWRNSFSFSRTPADEARLHLTLAIDGLVPVAAWDPQTQPTFNRDFHQLRQTRADHLHG